MNCISKNNNVTIQYCKAKNCQNKNIKDYDYQTLGIKISDISFLCNYVWMYVCADFYVLCMFSHVHIYSSRDGLETYSST